MSELYKDRMIMDSRMGFSGFVKKEIKEGDLLELWAEENKAKDGAKNEVVCFTYLLTHSLIPCLLASSIVINRKSYQ